MIKRMKNNYDKFTKLPALPDDDITIIIITDNIIVECVVGEVIQLRINEYNAEIFS
jgi:hypothetical protein